MSPWDPMFGVGGGLAAEAWKAAMLGLWNAGLWLLGLVLHIEDALLTPDLRSDGPAADAYGLTMWMAVSLAVLILITQLGLTLLRRDGRALGIALLGCAKFVMVWAAWVTWAVAVVAVCGSLTRAVLRSLLHVGSWSAWRPALRVSAEQIVDVTVATVLGLLGLVLWIAALGHVLVMLGRAVALLVLAATAPIAAAGLVGDVGKGWFWRSVRWFHAAALTPLLMALLLGIGVSTSTGVTAGLSDGPARAIGTALPSVLLILASCLAPMALFRLLSFVDPNTPTGSAFRGTLSAVLQTGMLLGGPGNWPSLPSRGDQLDSSVGASAGSSSSTSRTSSESSDADLSADRRVSAERNLGTDWTQSSAGESCAAGETGTGATESSADNAVAVPQTPPIGRTASTPPLGGSSSSAGPSSPGAAAGAGVAGESAAIPVVPV